MDDYHGHTAPENPEELIAQLGKNRALLNDVERIAGIGGWEMDLVTREAQWTQGTYDIVELEPGDPVPGPDEHISWYLPEYRPMIEQAMRALIEEDRPLDFEAQLKTAKGHIKWCRAVGRAERRDGRCVRVYGTFQDITDRKEIQKALEESTARYRTYVDHSPHGIFVTNREGRYIDVNPAACHTTGYSKEELLSMSISDMMPEDAAEPAKQHFELLRDKGRSSGVVPLLRKDGSRGWWRVEAVKLDDDRFLGLTTDLTEQHQLQVKLQRSEERLRRAQEIARIGSWEFDLNSRLVYASDEARRIYGLGSAVWTIKEVQTVPLPEYRPVLDRALDALVHHGQPYNVEFTIRRPSDGSIVEISSKAEYDPERHAVIGTIQDITDRKETERKLFEKDRQLRAVVEQAADCLILHDLDGHIVDVNTYSCRTYGYSREELLSMKINALDPDYEERAAGGAFWKDMKPYEPIMFEARQQTKDGRIFPVEVRLSMIRMQGRKLVLGLCRDITERKMAEEKAFENERMLRFAIDQLPVPVIIASAPDIEITHYNRAVVDLLARPIPTVEDIPLEDHREFWPTFYPDGTPYDIEDLPLTRAIHRGEVSHNVEIIVRHDNGDRWISANAAPLLDDRGRIVAGIVVFPDITDLKRAQNELEKHRGHLEEQVAQRTAELRKAVDLMAGREIRMAELKQTIAALRDRLKQAGITPENGKR